MYDAVSEVQAVVLANEGKCNTFRQQYSRFEYLWKKDLTASLQVRPANAFGSCATLHMQQSCCSCCQPAELLSQHFGRSGTRRLPGHQQAFPFLHAAYCTSCLAATAC